MLEPNDQDALGFELSFESWPHERSERRGMEIGEILDDPCPPAPDLHAAVESGNVSEVKRLIGLGVDPDQTSESLNQRPLHAALISAYCWDEAHWECFLLLLDAGADLDASDSQGNTPSIDAAIYGLDRHLRELARRGADLRIADLDGIAPLEHARNASNEACVEIILAEFAEQERLSIAAAFQAAPVGSTRSRL
jgi:ankyrin repeat protein